MYKISKKYIFMNYRDIIEIKIGEEKGGFCEYERRF